jgi:hypothetical protein
MSLPLAGNHCLFAPAGSGKTREAAETVQAHLDNGTDLDQILGMSYTRVGARKLSDRVTADSYVSSDDVRGFRTLHSLCYRLLGLERGQVVTDTQRAAFMQQQRLSFTPEYLPDHPDDYTPQPAHSRHAGNQLLQFIDWYRNRLLDLSTAFRIYDPPDELRRYWQLPFLNKLDGEWRAFKLSQNLYDFTDMLDEVYTSGEYPSWARVGLLDEAQDSTPMQLAIVQNWARHLQGFALLGDEDQCQPPGEPVLTTQGYVPIEQLNPDQHRIVGWNRRSGYVDGLRRGHAFETSCGPYEGWLTRVSVGTHTTRTTANHRWPVHWTDRAKTACVVYLMRQGERYRVGWCQLMRSDGIFHLGARARLEHADAAWALKYTDSRTEASKWESILSARYGIPTVMFEPSSVAVHYSRETLDDIFGELANVLPERAAMILRDFNLDVRYPLYSPESASERCHGSNLYMVHACNLVSEYMAVGVHEQSYKIAWEPITVEREWYSGPVYGLNVERYHLYFAAGLLTHNCIYSHIGTTPRAFMDFPAAQHFLTVNHRQGAALVDASRTLIQRNRDRMPKEITAGHDGGTILRWHAEQMRRTPPDPNIETFILARARYLLLPYVALLEQLGVPFVVRQGPGGLPWRRDQPDQGFAAFRAVQSLRAGHAVALTSLSALYSTLRGAEYVVRGWKKRIAEAAARENPQNPDELVHLSQLVDYGATEHLLAAIREDRPALLGRVPVERQSYWRRVVSRYGVDVLYTYPRIVLSTIHGVKGDEADDVYLIPDYPGAVQRHMRRRAGIEDERRIQYVALTRARARLFLLQPISIRHYHELSGIKPTRQAA